MKHPLSKALLRRACRNGPVLLMYHAIYEGRGKHWDWGLSLSRFREHMDLLCDNGWVSRPLAALGEAHSDLANTVVVTFDDGYQNNLEAVQVLQDRGMTGTFFVVTGDIGKTNARWKDSDAPSLQMLTPSDLLDMESAGMEVASHTVNHRRLTGESTGSVRAEMSQSMETLEQILQKRPVSVAYPYGLYDKRVIKAAKLAGYCIGCTTQAGGGRTAASLFEFPRISVYRWDTCSRLALKIAAEKNHVSSSDLTRNLLGQRP